MTRDDCTRERLEVGCKRRKILSCSRVEVGWFSPKFVGGFFDSVCAAVSSSVKDFMHVVSSHAWTCEDPIKGILKTIECSSRASL